MKKSNMNLLTGSPGVRVFEGEGEAVVYGCQLDDGILHYHPVCVLQKRQKDEINMYLSFFGVTLFFK